MSGTNISGSIYKVEPINGGENGDVYIGQTKCNLLCQRMARHRADYRCWKNGKRPYYTVYGLFDKYEVGSCRIVLLESVYGTQDYLNAREIHYIKTIDCVNICGKKK